MASRRWIGLVVALIAGVACTRDFDGLLTPSPEPSSTASSTAAGSSAASSASSAGSGGGGSGGGGATQASSTGVGGTGGSGGLPVPSAIVPCNGQPCAPGEVCCFDNLTDTETGCAPAGTCPAGQIEVACDGPEDCDGKLCCGYWDGTYQSVLCERACSDPNDYVMCGGNNPSACPAGKGCWVSDTLDGYWYCE